MCIVSWSAVEVIDANLRFVSKYWSELIPYPSSKVYVLKIILPTTGLPYWKVESGIVVPSNVLQLTPVAP